MNLTITMILSVTMSLVINFSTLTIFFDSKGGTDIPEINLTASNLTFEMPEDPIREGYLFDGWYYESDEESSEAIVFDENFDMAQINASEDQDHVTITIYAKWIEGERMVVGLPPQILPNEVFYTSLFIELDEEIIPLADALPETSQMPIVIFYGLGSILLSMGVLLKMKS